MGTDRLDKNDWMDRFRAEWDRLSEGQYEADYQFSFEHTIYPFFQDHGPEIAANTLFNRDYKNVPVEKIRVPGSVDAAIWKFDCLWAFDNSPRTVPLNVHKAIELLWQTRPESSPWEAVRDFVDTMQAEYDQSQATKH